MFCVLHASVRGNLVKLKKTITFDEWRYYTAIFSAWEDESESGKVQTAFWDRNDCFTLLAQAWLFANICTGKHKANNKKNSDIEGE